MKRMLLLLMLVLISTATPRSAAGQSSPADHPPKTPSQVAVGLYVNQIYELSLKDNNIVIDFWIWFRWTNDALKPYKTFEIKNARIDTKGDVTLKKVGDVNYGYLRVVANLTQFWDVRAYPLDSHVVNIMVEDVDHETSQLVYVPDVEASGIGEDVSGLAFAISHGTPSVAPATYRSNYGDPSLSAGNSTEYSRFTLPLQFKREGLGYFMKTFFGLFVAASIAFLAFFMKPSDLDPRFGLGVGAIFAAIASEYVIVGALPESSALSLADKLHIIAFSAILLSLGQSTYSLYLFTNNNEEKSKKLDFLSAILVPSGYLFATVLAVLLR